MKRNRALYICLLSFSLALVLLSGSKAACVTFYTMLLLPAVSAFLGRYFLRALAVKQSLDRDLVLKGEQTVFRISVLNQSPLFNPNVLFIFSEGHFAIDSSARNTAVTFRPKALRDLEFTLSCKYRGAYDIGARAIQTKDFLGLWNLSVPLKDNARLTVYPRVIEIHKFPLSMNLLSKAFSRYDVRSEDYSTVSDVRPYEASDSVKKIHWKLSAKRGELIVKNYETSAMNSIALFMDTRKSGASPAESLAVEDKMAEIAVAIGYYCLRKQLPIEFRYGAGRRLSAANIMDFEKLYSICAHMDFDEEDELDGRIPAFLNEQTNPLNLIFITPHMSDRLLNELVNAWHFGHHVVSVYVPPTLEDEKERRVFSLLAEAGMPCFYVRAEDEIVDIF
ncbi:MAG: DUF58 domain-containing protein [Clostridiales bacterium]|jgi:uncharacterized protein (DUF58 family)|nr:DUF58 domain-containing protein [Clostridiales bacterium]